MGTISTKPMAPREHSPSVPASLKPADILYILFRHKWKILIVSLAGIVAAGVVAARWPHFYESYAELLIKYIQDAKTPTPNSDTTAVNPSDDIINPELELLRSRDLAERVVDSVSAKTVLAKVDGSDNRDEAINLVRSGLSAEALNHSSVIFVKFDHVDLSVVQPVLRSVIDNYFKLHAELHRIGELDEPLAKEADQWQQHLLEIEAEIRSAQTNAGIISLEDTKKSYSDEMNDIRRQLSEAVAEFNERKAALDAVAVATNSEPAANTNASSIPDSVLEDYRRAQHMIAYWTKEQSDAEVTYVDGTPKLRQIAAHLAAAEKQKRDLEDKNPGLAAVAPLTNDSDGGQRSARAAQLAELQNLGVKIKVLNARMVNIQKGLVDLSNYEEKTTDLERKQRLDQETYEQFAKAVAQARIADRFRNGQVWNISSIQTPTPPATISPGKKMKTIGMILFGTIGGVLALVFLLEMYVDQSLKRPVDVEAHLHLPMFMNIPRFGRNGKVHSLSRARKVPLIAEKTQSERPTAGWDGNHAGGGGAPVNGKALQVAAALETGPWDPRHEVRCYAEALRDRLITYFEVNNLTHKPKLVAVTSCGERAGVSTVAAGLAASLSETGEGNVLLVDMNDIGAAHQFYKGELACGIDDALEKEKRDNALVRDNLYVVMEETSNNDTLPRALPKRFKHLVPRLRASDYDYIIFDMPPVSQISVTPRLARFMDMVLVVVESEKTNRDVVKRASSLLAEAGAHVGVVLNKSKSYVPRALSQEV